MAVERFRWLRAHTLRRSLWRKGLGQPTTLLNLSDVLAGRHIVNHHALGLQTVPLQRIRGSEGRAADFDAEFRPLKAHIRERWVSIALARLNDQPLPPVELVQIGECYFVRDGHHRVSVATVDGQADIDAVVVRWELADRAQPLPSPVRSAQGATAPSGQWLAATCRALLRQLLRRNWPALQPPAQQVT